MMYNFTRTYETYYDCFVEADSLEDAIDILNNVDDSEWVEELDTQDQVIRFRSRTTWALMNEDGEIEEEGEVEV